MLLEFHDATQGIGSWFIQLATWLKLKLYKMSILQSIVIVCKSFDMSS